MSNEDDLDAATTESTPITPATLTLAEGLQLLESYRAISDPDVRAAIQRFLAAVAAK